MAVLSAPQDQMPFSKLKANLRKAAERTMPRLRRRICRFAATLTAREASNYFRHAGFARNPSPGTNVSEVAILRPAPPFFGGTLAVSVCAVPPIQIVSWDYAGAAACLFRKPREGLTERNTRAKFPEPNKLFSLAFKQSLTKKSDLIFWDEWARLNTNPGHRLLVVLKVPIPTLERLFLL
jgi:hypothetical protein